MLGTDHWGTASAEHILVRAAVRTSGHYAGTSTQDALAERILQVAREYSKHKEENRRNRLRPAS